MYIIIVCVAHANEMVLKIQIICYCSSYVAKVLCVLFAQQVATLITSMGFFLADVAASMAQGGLRSCYGCGWVFCHTAGQFKPRGSGTDSNGSGERSGRYGMFPQGCPRRSKLVWIPYYLEFSDCTFQLLVNIYGADNEGGSTLMITPY